MRFKDYALIRQNLLEMAQVRSISPEEAKENNLFGPVYHGTNEENRSLISQHGFKVFQGASRTGPITNGFEIFDYHENIPPPIHHLGFGVYFTTRKQKAKIFNRNTTKGLQGYYIYAPRLETINWGTRKTMMRWWRENGYNMPPINQLQGDPETERIEATKNLTNVLASKYDAVWYKGKGFGELLDGDQICVFNPDNIFLVDNSLSPGYEMNGVTVRLGDRVSIKDTKVTAKVLAIRPIPSGLAYDIETRLWKAVLGQFDYFLSVSIDKNGFQAIKDAHSEKLMQATLKAQDEEFFAKRIELKGSKKASAQSYVDYVLEKSRLARQFPSGMVVPKK